MQQRPYTFILLVVCSFASNLERLIGGGGAQWKDFLPQTQYRTTQGLTCEHNPCENGGMCVDSGITYACICSPGFKGINCELKNDVCSSKPCGSVGKCSPWADDYICECPDQVYDKCCCNGVRNKCSQQQQYYAHNATSFVHCDAAGNAYLKTCAPGLVWDQSLLTCNRPSALSQPPAMNTHTFLSSPFNMPEQSRRSFDASPFNDRPVDYSQYFDAAADNGKKWDLNSIYDKLRADDYMQNARFNADFEGLSSPYQQEDLKQDGTELRPHVLEGPSADRFAQKWNLEKLEDGGNNPHFIRRSRSE